MNPTYKTALGLNAQALVDRIEKFAEREVQVVVDPSVKVSPTDPNPTRPEAAVTEHWARITLPTPSFVPNGIVHELLHIERYWIEGIPQIEPVDQKAGNSWEITSSIENHLEHLIIVPREELYGFDPYPYWANTDKVLWGRYPWPEITEPFARRKNALLGALSAFNLSKSDDLIEQVKGYLEKDGMLKETIRFNRLIRDVLHSKEKMIRLTVEHLGIPKSEARVRYIDVRTGRRWYAPV
jgi:hypothetical protein